MKTKIRKSGSPLALPTACVGQIQFDIEPTVAKKDKSITGKCTRETKLKISAVDRIGIAQIVTKVKFGSVTVAVYGRRTAEVKRNIREGQVALSRAINTIIRPGVKIEVTESVPLFHADPTQPGRIVRVLKGKRVSGVFVNGKFKARR